MRIASFFLLVAMSVSSAWAGNISGQIQGRNWMADKPARETCYWRLGPGMHPPAPPMDRVNQAVVILERVPRQGTNNENDPVIIQIKGIEFSPSFLVTSPHTTVTFKNLDQRSYSCSAIGPNAFQIN